MKQAGSRGIAPDPRGKEGNALSQSTATFCSLWYRFSGVLGALIPPENWFLVHQEYSGAQITSWSVGVTPLKQLFSP